MVSGAEDGCRGGPSTPGWPGSIPPTPADLVAYTWAGLRAWQAGAPHAIHFQQPGSPVRYEPGYEHELTLLGRPSHR